MTTDTPRTDAKMKSENLEMVKIIIYDWVASAYWWLSWNTIFGDEDYSTKMWIKTQRMKADWCANHVYHGSAWHGLIASVDGIKAVVHVTLNPTDK
jgi:hypothetical protein